MFGTVRHREDTSATVDRLVQGFNDCHARLRQLEISEEQLDSKTALARTVNVDAAVNWHDDGGRRIGGEITEKAMQEHVRFDTLQRSYDEPPSLTDAASPPPSQDALHDGDYSLQVLRHLGPDATYTLDGAMERQRAMIDAAHHALDGLGGANRALLADLTESRAQAVSLAAALDDLHAVHRAAEASAEQQLERLYAAQSELSAFHRVAAVERDELARRQEEIEILHGELRRLRADGAAIHGENACMQNTIAAQCRAEVVLRGEVAERTAEKESVEAELAGAQDEIRSLKACLQDKDAFIDGLRRDVEALVAEKETVEVEKASSQRENMSLKACLEGKDTFIDTLRRELASLTADKETVEGEIASSQDENMSLKACLQGKDAFIDALRRQVDNEKRARQSAHSLLVAISGLPAQGQHWEDLSASLKLSRQSPCASSAGGWQWLPAWDDGAQPADTHHSTTAALCFACVCLHHWMDDHGRARDCLQALVNSLHGAAELPVGLCHTVLFAVLDAAGRRPLRFDIALLLCQAAQLIAAKCRSERRSEAAAKVRACASRDCADGALLDALLDGDDLASRRVPFCTPTLAQEGQIVYVQSIDSLLFVSREKSRLRWISVRCIDWTKSSVDAVHLRSGDVSQKVKFGQVGVELFKALLHL